MKWPWSRTALLPSGAVQHEVQELHASLDHARIGLGQVGLDGRWLAMNRHLPAILGHAPEELAQRNYLDLMPPEDLPADRDLARQLLDGTLENVRVQRRLLGADGRPVWVMLSARLLRAADGAPECFDLIVEDINELKSAEAALRQLVHALPDMVWVKDRDGRYLRCNAEALRLFGYAEDDLIGRRDKELFGPERAARYRAEDLGVMNSSRPTCIEEWQTSATDGRRVLLEITKTPLSSVGGPLQGVLCVARDITGRHDTAERLGAAERQTRQLLTEAEQARRVLLSVIEDQRQVQESLRASEERLRITLEGSSTGLWDWELITGHIIYSDTFRQLLRHEGPCFEADFALRERLHPEDRERIIAAVHHSLDDGVLFDEDYRLLCFDNQWRWFHGRGNSHRSAEGGRTVRFSGILTDLTERRGAEERQRLAAAVIDSTQEGVMITDHERRIVSVNRAFTELLGYREDEVLGRTPALLHSDRQDPLFYQQMWQQIGRTGCWQGEVWNRRKSGEMFPEWLSISAVRDSRQQITHYVGVFADISQLKASEAELEFLAHHDPLTRLPNRLLFLTRLQDLIGSAQRAAVLMLDLDRFKDVNDSYGHLAGDELLGQVAGRLSARLPECALLARLGGDEFAVLLPDLMRPEDAARLARELIEALCHPWHLSNGAEVVIGASVGICLLPDHGNTPQALLQGADAALYRAKADGRGVHRYYSDDLTLAARSRLDMEARLRRALAERQLQLGYQPQYEIASGRLVGAEVLLQWTDPELGPVPAARFIPVAEATGMIGEIGAWVLREACQQGQRWLDEGLPTLMLAVNVSPRQFRHGDLAELVTHVLSETGYPAQHLELELTESALMERESEVQATLQKLRGLGVNLAIDDFGTGYSSLAYLKRFPLDVLKIDRGFIAEIPHNRDDMEIAAAVIAMGHSLGLKVLAEGVENEAQLAFLRLKGCDFFQGFLRHRPLPARVMAAVLRESCAT